jgi:CheY-like chemotaxis protein
MPKNKNEKKTILLVEDNMPLRHIYSVLLSDHGYRVLEAVTGKEALKKARTHDWDLMLLDIMLPEMDGVTLLRELVSSDPRPSGPIVIITNLSSEDFIKECFELGVVGYLIKAEITPDKVLNEVTTWLAA